MKPSVQSIEVVLCEFCRTPVTVDVHVEELFSRVHSTPWEDVPDDMLDKLMFCSEKCKGRFDGGFDVSPCEWCDRLIWDDGFPHFHDWDCDRMCALCYRRRILGLGQPWRDFGGDEEEMTVIEYPDCLDNRTVPYDALLNEWYKPVEPFIMYDSTLPKNCEVYNRRALEFIDAGSCVVTYVDSRQYPWAVTMMMKKGKYIKEASRATKAWLMLCYRFGRDGVPLIKDIAKMIGRMVYASASDVVWERTRPSDVHPKDKRHRVAE